MFIREDRKSVIFTRNFPLKFGHSKTTRFCQNLSYNFHLLSMLRDGRSFHGLRHAVGRDKSMNFSICLLAKTVSLSFLQETLH